METETEKDRMTINLTKGLVNKLDLLRYGSESWNSFLDKAYPILLNWRKEEIEKRLNNQ